MKDEEEARAWIASQFGRSAVATMQTIIDLVIAESAHQNLIAPSTTESIWGRHIVDSAQLLTLLPPVTPNDNWIDIGSGAGFPGLVVAALGSCNVVLVEPRKRRAEFLAVAVAALGLSGRTRILCSRIENVGEPATIISARAVGRIGDIFQWSAGCSDRQTQWVLPKGQSARDEVETAKKTWHGMFHVKHSITDSNSLIVLASGIARR